MNRILLIGNLTRDPELRATAGGVSLPEVCAARREVVDAAGGDLRRAIIIAQAAVVSHSFWAMTPNVLRELVLPRVQRYMQLSVIMFSEERRTGD